MSNWSRAWVVSDRIDEAIDDVWSKTLSQISTSFGRLAYLASLRDPNSGRYRHYGLSQIYGEDETHRVLNSSHEQVFAEWLNFTLRRQREDLDDYFEDSDEEPVQVIHAWKTLKPYLGLAPAGAGEAERYLYASDLELILELIQAEISESSSSA